MMHLHIASCLQLCEGLTVLEIQKRMGHFIVLILNLANKSFLNLSIYLKSAIEDKGDRRGIFQFSFKAKEC